MTDWEDEVGGETGSDGYESPDQAGTAAELEEQLELVEEERDENVGSSSSSASEAGSSSDEEDDAQASFENDLFGPDNEDYVRATPHSQLPIPTLPEPRNDDFRRNHRGGGGGGGFNNRNSGGGVGASPAYYSGGYKKDMLVADLKLGPLGHSDETLRVSCPPFQEPNQICCFSRTADGAVHYDERCLRKFRRRVLVNFEADLNEGFESFVEKREDTESKGFGDLLACLRTKMTSLKDIHFVTFRNNMNKILGTTYNRRDPWEMGVYKRSGTVYLNVRQLPESPPTEIQQRQCYWGYKYEEVATENSERDLYEMSGDLGLSSVIDANTEFCTVVRTKLGAHRIIMGAEIDCYDLGSDGHKRYTELKTSRELDKRTVERYEREKLLKFWIQSFLVGVPKIVCGFRDDHGRLMRSEMMLTQEVARRMKHKHYWEGAVCLAFADRVLCWLYGSCVENENYVLRYSPNVGRLELWKDDSCPAVINEHIEQMASNMQRPSS